MALILWDYDGVLANSMEIEAKYYTAACHEAGIEQISTYEDIARLCEGNYYEECTKAGLDPKKVEIATYIFEKTIKELGCQIDVFPGMPEIMIETARWFPSYIITSNSSATVETMLKNQQIKGIREVLGFEVEKSKTKKINHVKTLFPGEKTYFISDTAGDILEARAGGVDVTVGVTWGMHSADILIKSHPDYLFNQVSELREFLFSLFEGGPLLQKENINSGTVL